MGGEVSSRDEGSSVGGIEGLGVGGVEGSGVGDVVGDVEGVGVGDDTGADVGDADFVGEVVGYWVLENSITNSGPPKFLLQSVLAKSTTPCGSSE